MFKAKVISGHEFPYHPKNNPTETKTAFQIWFTFEGVSYSFKMSFFQADQIEKAKAGLTAGYVNFNLEPDNYMAPRFVLA